MFNYFVFFIWCPWLLLLLLTLGCEPFSWNIIVGSPSKPLCCCYICSLSFLNLSRWKIISSNWFSGTFWFIFSGARKSASFLLNVNRIIPFFQDNKYILEKYFINIYITYYVYAASSTAAIISLQFIKLIHKDHYACPQKQQHYSQTPQHICTLFWNLLNRASLI